jgi:hypothetical protein
MTKFLVGIFKDGKPEDVKIVDMPESAIAFLDALVGYISKDIPAIDGRFFAFDYASNHIPKGEP